MSSRVSPSRRSSHGGVVSRPPSAVEHEALHRRTQRPARVAAAMAAVVLAATPVLASAPAHAHTSGCRVSWGSLPEADDRGSTGSITDVRTGRHACFDRLVLTVSGEANGFFVRYVEQVRRDGSGAVVPVRGGARLEVVVTAPAVPTDAWFLPNGELLAPRGYRTFRHLAWAGSFEGQSTFGLGVRSRLPFRVLVLDGPGTGSRVVLDVAHRW